MKEPVDSSQNCACGACRNEWYKYLAEMKKYKEWKERQPFNEPSTLTIKEKVWVGKKKKIS